MAEHFVYLLDMADGRIYTGHSNCPIRRETEHRLGKGSRTTRIFEAGKIIYTESHPDRASAVRRERQIKRWTRAKKLALIAGDTRALKALAHSRDDE